MGGIAATASHVFFGDRDVEDFFDVYRCVDANTGEEQWEVRRLAIGALDYGNSPRATPLVLGDRVIFLGAFGDLVCVAVVDGEVLWEHQLAQKFPADRELPWGYCGSPLEVDGKIIVAPGSEQASLIAVSPDDGSILWQTEGIGPCYGSLHYGRLGGRMQIVGHDAESIGGWDAETGKRLWRVQPDVEGDFNVPTPIIDNGRLLITTENNGARLYAFTEDGMIHPDPIAWNNRLRTDMSTGVVVGDLLFCVKDFLFCLDLKDDLKERWRLRDRSISDYGAIVASPDHMAVFGDGEILIFKTDGDKNMVSRIALFDEDIPLYSHPAFVGNKLYVRGERKLVCLRWD